jgi:hypothetical protein
LEDLFNRICLASLTKLEYLVVNLLLGVLQVIIVACFNL